MLPVAEQVDAGDVADVVEGDGVGRRQQGRGDAGGPVVAAVELAGDGHRVARRRPGVHAEAGLPLVPGVGGGAITGRRGALSPWVDALDVAAIEGVGADPAAVAGGCASRRAGSRAATETSAPCVALALLVMMLITPLTAFAPQIAAAGTADDLDAVDVLEQRCPAPPRRRPQNNGV